MAFIRETKGAILWGHGSVHDLTQRVPIDVIYAAEISVPAVKGLAAIKVRTADDFMTVADMLAAEDRFEAVGVELVSPGELAPLAVANQKSQRFEFFGDSRGRRHSRGSEDHQRQHHQPPPAISSGR